MDDKHAGTGTGTARNSGIPRLSRLPLPRSTPSTTTSGSLRTPPSRESLTSQLPKQRLRPVASRDQLPRAQAPSATKPTGLSSSRPAPRRNISGLTQAAPAPKPRPSLSRQPSEPQLPRSRSSTTASTTGSTPASTTSQSPESTHSVASEIEGDIYGTLRPRSSRPRPSLSERTIETLSQLPSSPALSKKSSSFFDADGFRRPRSRAGSNTSRPGSSYTSDGSMRPPSQGRSRPGSSSSAAEESALSNFRASTNSSRVPLDTIHGTPSRRVSSIASLRTPNFKGTTRVSGVSKFAASTTSQPPSRTQSPARPTSVATPSKPVAKTVSARPLKPRASVQGLFKRPSMSNLDAPAPAESKAPAFKTPVKTPAATRTLKLRAPAPATPSATGETVEKEAPHIKASAALREQIAKAKAAKKAALMVTVEPEADTEASPDDSLAAPAKRRLPLKSPIIPVDDGFDFGLDPFNTNRSEDAAKKVLQSRLAQGRTSGRLNIAALGLKTIPTEVLNMYDSETMGTYDGSWAESVDLTRFVAAGNELEIIDDTVFPDKPLEELAEDEDSAGNIFGGLELLDLHGNNLIAVPRGLRQLPQLTTLNLSSNRLANNCLEPISEITTLRDLKLANNLFYGPVDPCFSNLQNLEILDLHGNNISSLPVNFGNLERLRNFNISENSLEVLPFSALAKMPLNELLAQKNQLSGTLIEAGVDVMPKLQTLDISCNQLTYIVAPGSTVAFPLLHQLTMSMNRMKALPNVTSWTSLLTLTADENTIAEFPEGFLTLERLRHVDFTANDIRIVPSELARMDNLTMIRLSGNPLRDKKFISFTTEELKDALSARLEPPPPYQDVAITDVEVKVSANPKATFPPAPLDEQDGDSRSDLDDFATPPTSAPHSPARSRSHTLTSQTWPVKQGGLLDRSNTESSSLHPVVCSKVAAAVRITEVQLHHNMFTVLPESLSFFAETLTALSLAHNKLVGETYLPAELDLPALRELNLANNTITSLAPLTANLRAPALEKVDISKNRVSGLPADLREAFPALVVLLAANNHLEELDPEVIRGLQVVDAGYNEITHLNPKIGLLGGHGGLRQLDVMGNRFRVPRWNVLERGTDATLRWLRGRVPVAEMAKWKESHGDAGGMSDDYDEVD
ncbi:leucine-rich repeat-containing protein [Plectosphaerella plurivora]|uniref:Leucine-rich repeat-containing protein n=1 Tax=Plectosphaerella plurivora TaxID=936078 RepID=A0A9P9ADZ0_9PEZI|nr:leucine-rich repeat-containing protein [Plectosphaerella plurivora]